MRHWCVLYFKLYIENIPKGERSIRTDKNDVLIFLTLIFVFQISDVRLFCVRFIFFLTFPPRKL